MPSPPSQVRPFSLLVKPASADCNLRCDYCFYLKKKELYPDTIRHRMSDTVLEQLISSYMATPQPTYSIGWQGGEPSLMGIDFFRKVVALEKKYGKPGSVVANGLQTNATLIDDEFAEFLGRNNFLVGVSIDGPRNIHDIYRKDAGGRGSHHSVMKGVEALKRHDVAYNVLTLVSSSNVEKASRIYEYLLDLGVHYHQYIPCVEFDEAGEPLPYTITGRQWGTFLVELFDTWKKRDVRRISIRDFDAIVGHMATGQYSMCVQSGICNSYFVVEHNGDIYPCDFFVERSKRIGSVMSDSWLALQQSKRYRNFGAQKAAWGNACTQCPYLRYCSGDCIKQRIYGGTRDPSNISWLCEGWKQFYSHSLPTFEKIAIDIMNEREAESHPQSPRHYTRIYTPKLGWNDPCYCGSGKKYRLCHGVSSGRTGS